MFTHFSLSVSEGNIGSKAKFADEIKSAIPARRKVILISNQNKKPLNSRKVRVSHPILRKAPQLKGFKRPKKSIPKVLPEHRRKDFETTEESDADILNVTREIELDSANSSSDRGRLLRLSTLKPPVSDPLPTATVDQISEGSVDTVKRIVRIVNRPSQPVSLDIEVQRAKKNIGTQVGLSLGEFLKRKRESVPPIVTAGPEVPLQGFWTHRVNLPYPPQGEITAPQFVVQPQQQLQQQLQQQQVYYAQQQAYYQQPPQNQVVYLPQKNYSSGQFMNRRQRRNYNKSQKHQQRRANQNN